ncbi:MAG: AbrB/MazE/SpoVT family DNA-binding domain-containing protein [Betaproteobacteria bacterium]|nr:AbrB/MazE/SpoVT family DNA-binding domain-containing protein [Betaproteobacteria bacterium]MBI2961895.1 AbrB/MazE/SpoVT family DNA-binding domain-containing protein [Betaproteobacteria bacterium]
MATLTKVVKIFRNGGSQAIRLPKEFAVDTKEVVLRKDFGVISILPKRKGSLVDLLREIGPIDLAPRDQPGWTDRRSDSALRPARRRPRR